MIKFENLENIVFDLGGVLLNISALKVIEGFKKIGFDNFDTKYKEMIAAGIFDKFETGEISADSFRDAVRQFGEKNFSDQEIDVAWNSMLLDFPQERFEILEKLKSSFNLFLLSNTNIIHYENYSESFERKFGRKMETCFKKACFSHEMGLRKPDAAIFVKMMKENGMDPDKTLFIDDTFENIKSAGSLGLTAYWLSSEETVSDVFAPVL